MENDSGEKRQTEDASGTDAAAPRSSPERERAGARNEPDPSGRHGDTRGNDARSGEPDVLLDVPAVDVDEISLKVQDLRARVALHAAVGNLVSLDVGADAYVERVELEIKGVHAQALLKVHLDRVYDILARTLATVDSNPQLLEAVLQPLGRTVDALGKTVEETVPALGKDVGRTVRDTVPEVGKAVGHTVDKTVPEIGKTVGNVTHMIDKTAPEIGSTVGHTVDKAAPEIGSTVGRTSAGDVEGPPPAMATKAAEHPRALGAEEPRDGPEAPGRLSRILQGARRRRRAEGKHTPGAPRTNSPGIVKRLQHHLREGRNAARASRPIRKITEWRSQAGHATRKASDE